MPLSQLFRSGARTIGSAQFSTAAQKRDPLGRSVAHLSDLLTRFRDNGIHFCSLIKGIDAATLGGKLVFYVFAAVAEFQRDLIWENTISGLQLRENAVTVSGGPICSR